MTLRFVHTADWHLGKPFGQLSEAEDGDLGARLREARFAAVGRIAALARAEAAPLVLVAGDVFDSEAPSARTIAQLLDTIAAERDIAWVMLPGNHDPARLGGLWERIAAEAPPNLSVAAKEAPIEPCPGLALLPAPRRERQAGRDTTAWMDAAATPEGALRIGLAHGPVRDFAEVAQSDVISPERADRAGLGYLALGDWHGAQRVGPRAWYAGTPEPDAFGQGRSGHALVVALSGPGAEPEVALHEIGQFAWVEAAHACLPGEAPESVLAGLLPDGRARRDTLLALSLSGHLGLAERAAWARASAALARRLACLRLDTDRLETLRSADDLDLIAETGALRTAADALAAEAEDDRLPPGARLAARDALDLLFTWCHAPEDRERTADLASPP